MESFKINYIMYGTGRTGGTRVLFNFMNELVKLGHQVSLTTTYYDDWFPLSKDVKIIAKRTKAELYLSYGMQKLNKNKELLYNIELLRKLKDRSPKSDINVATFSPTAYAASWKSSDGSTAFYHMQHFETIFFKDPLMKKFVYDTYYLPIYKIANSVWLQKKLKLVTDIEYPIVNAAVEHDIFYQRDPSYKSDKIINIVALGKGGWKNAQGIFKAVKLVRDKIPDKKIVLHYFGNSPPNGIRFDGNETIFHRNLSDEQLAVLYSNSDIQVTFSTAESFPLPPLEAMACGCSVITTPYGTEDYAIDNYNSLIVEPNNVEMLADKIRKLIEDENLKRKLMENGLKTASGFNYLSQTKVLEAKFKEALDKSSNNHWRDTLI